MDQSSAYRKAETFYEIDNAVRRDIPIDANHPFFTDFSDVRGEFEEKSLLRALNVDSRNLTYNANINRSNKTLLFLAGMRGSGKTTELAKIGQKLSHPDAFMVITCNIENTLDMNDLEYMDILIFQLERLLEELNNKKIRVENEIISTLQTWFSERVKEVNTAMKAESGLEIEIGTTSGISILSFLGLAGKVKGSMMGSKESATLIRNVFRKNFSDFAIKVNEFLGYINEEIRRSNIGKEILFIIDGLEKVANPDTRKEIVVHDINWIKQIQANTIFTLPIELQKESRRLSLEHNAQVIPFPFIKIREKDDTYIEKAIDRFMDFTLKRIDEKLFDNRDTIRRGILVGGGSPREYLTILEYASIYADEDKGIIDREAMEKGIRKLAAQSARFINPSDLEKLKELNKRNHEGIPTTDMDLQELLEKLIVMEYNDGSYARVNPVIEASDLYQYYVGK